MGFSGISIHKITHVFILKTMTVNNANVDAFILFAIHGFYLKPFMLITHNFHQWFCSMLFRGIPIHKTTHVFILKTMLVININTNVF